MKSSKGSLTNSSVSKSSFNLSSLQTHSFNDRIVQFSDVSQQKYSSNLSFTRESNSASSSTSSFLSKFLGMQCRIREDYAKWREVLKSRLNKEFGNLKSILFAAINEMEQSYLLRMNENYQSVLDTVVQVKNAAKQLGEQTREKERQHYLLKSLQSHKISLLNRSRSCESVGLSKTITHVKEIEQLLQETNEYYGERQDKIRNIEQIAKRLVNYKEQLESNTQQILQQFIIYKKILLKPIVRIKQHA